MIKIICIGKLKENYLKEALKDYEKRLSKYTKIEIIELADINTPDIKKSVEEEGKNILKQINNRDYVITLEIEGKMLSSTELSEKLDNINLEASNLSFIIGGSNGISEDVKKRSNFRLSFSKLTFPHGLFRIILLEQLYRTYKIRNNEKYHK